MIKETANKDPLVFIFKKTYSKFKINIPERCEN